MEYFNTYGGNPVSCAIASAVLDVIEDEGLMRHARDVGGLLLDGFSRLKSRHPDLVGDVRGRGMFVGVDLVTDAATRRPNPEAGRHVIARWSEAEPFFKKNARTNFFFQVEGEKDPAAD